MIEIKNIVKKYKKRPVLDGVSFNVKEGKITCLLGINGVGKSTTLKAIMGLIPINSGEIFIDGEKISPTIYNKIAFIPDVLNNYPNFTIAEHFEFMSTFYENWDNEKAERMLAYFKLTKDQKISELSKGNAAKVKLIAGFAQKSKYLLMDEPFSGIDFITREEFIKAITGEFAEEDQGILITTHEILEIENIADDVILLDDGKVVRQFSAEEEREVNGRSITDVMREVFKNE